MENSYWQHRWQTNDIKFNQEQANEFLQRYWKDLALNKESRVFVPLCGKSVDMLWLAEQGHSVIGVELSPIACAAFFTENNLDFEVNNKANFKVYTAEKITLFCGDIFDLTIELTGRINAVFDRAALFALPLELRTLYAEHIIKLLDSRAKMLLVTYYYDQHEMNGPPFSVSEAEVKQLYGAHFKINKLLDEVAEVKPHHKVRGLTHANDVIYSLTSLQG